MPPVWVQVAFDNALRKHPGKRVEIVRYVGSVDAPDHLKWYISIRD